MKNSQQGFIIPFVIFLIIVIAAIGGIYFYEKNTNSNFADISSNTATSAATTTDAMSSAGTVSTVDWRTYSDASLGFSFKYPPAWNAPVRSVAGSNIEISISGLDIEYRPNYDPVSGQADTFQQVVSSTGNQTAQKNIFTLSGKAAAEITCPASLENCFGITDDVLVALDSTHTLTISNNEGEIDPHIFASIISSFVFKDLAGPTPLQKMSWYLYTNTTYGFSLNYPSVSSDIQEYPNGGQQECIPEDAGNNISVNAVQAALMNNGDMSVTVVCEPLTQKNAQLKAGVVLNGDIENDNLKTTILGSTTVYEQDVVTSTGDNWKIIDIPLDVSRYVEVAYPLETLKIFKKKRC